MTSAWKAYLKWEVSATMAAKLASRSKSESGQSIIEFVIFIPLFVGLTVLLIRANTTIQMSVVNQKYIRAQTLFISENSAYYPRRDLYDSSLAAKGLGRMDIGVSENSYAEDRPNQAVPEASLLNIARPGQLVVGDQAGDPNVGTGRSRVRLRTTVSLCSSHRDVDSTSNVPHFIYCKGID